MHAPPRWVADTPRTLTTNTLRYDPRTRPWYMMGATGPKDVIVILDTSGSMAKADRMTSAKIAAMEVVDSLTNMDRVNIVTFSTGASSKNTVLVPAEWAYRQTLKQQISEISPGGFTYYTKAMKLAFEITAKSDGLGLNSGCTRVYVFMTDGESTDAISTFTSTIQANRRPTEHATKRTPEQEVRRTSRQVSLQMDRQNAKQVREGDGQVGRRPANLELSRPRSSQICVILVCSRGVFIPHSRPAEIENGLKQA